MYACTLCTSFMHRRNKGGHPEYVSFMHTPNQLPPLWNDTFELLQYACVAIAKLSVCAAYLFQVFCVYSVNGWVCGCEALNYLNCNGTSSVGNFGLVKTQNEMPPIYIYERICECIWQSINESTIWNAGEIYHFWENNTTSCSNFTRFSNTQWAMCIAVAVAATSATVRTN